MFAWPNSRSYTAISLTLWLIFLGSLIALNIGMAESWPAISLWGLALSPALTVLFQTVIAYRHISGQDEFIRALTAKRMIFAIGITLTLLTGWGAFEGFLNLPHLPLWLAYPLFWGVFGVSSPFIRGALA